jgi:hypothetical protein
MPSPSFHARGTGGRRRPYGIREALDLGELVFYWIHKKYIRPTEF